MNEDRRGGMGVGIGIRVEDIKRSRDYGLSVLSWWVEICENR